MIQRILFKKSNRSKFSLFRIILKPNVILSVNRCGCRTIDQLMKCKCGKNIYNNYKKDSKSNAFCKYIWNCNINVVPINEKTRIPSINWRKKKRNQSFECVRLMMRQDGATKQCHVHSYCSLYPSFFFAFSIYLIWIHSLNWPLCCSLVVLFFFISDTDTWHWITHQ